MNPYELLKNAKNVKWKNETWTVGDITEDWVELEDQSGVPILVTMKKIKNAKKKGKDVEIQTEANTYSEYAGRVCELAGVIDDEGEHLYLVENTRSNAEDIKYFKQKLEEGSWNNYAVRYSMYNKQDRPVTKEKTFKTEKARDKFVEKISSHDDFIQILAYSDPQ